MVFIRSFFANLKIITKTIDHTKPTQIYAAGNVLIINNEITIPKIIVLNIFTSIFLSFHRMPQPNSYPSVELKVKLFQLILLGIYSMFPMKL